MIRTCFLLVAAAAFAQDDTAEYFPLKVGNEWRFKHSSGEITWTVDRKEKVGNVECFLLRHRAKVRGQEKENLLWLTADKEGVRIHKAYQEVIRDPQFMFKFPLKRGEKWTAKLKNSTSSCIVDGEEDLKTPAGEFKAFKVTETVRAGRATQVVSYFLAKDTGPVRLSFVAESAQLNFDLVKFTPGK